MFLLLFYIVVSVAIAFVCYFAFISVHGMNTVHRQDAVNGEDAVDRVVKENFGKSTEDSSRAICTGNVT